MFEKSTVDCEWKDILHDYGPLQSLGFYLIITLSVVANLSIIALMMMVENDYNRTAAMIFVLFLSFLPYAFLTIKYHRFLKRNIVGYNLWYYFSEQKQINVITILPRDSYYYFTPKCACAIVVPLGGWFNKQPRIWYGARFKFDKTGTCWGLNNFKPLDSHDLNFSYFAINVTSRHGEEVNLEIHEALQLIRDTMFEPSVVPPAMPIGMRYFMCHTAKRLLQWRNFELFGLLVQTVTAIAETKRFGKSKEGARIREQLTEDILKLMPENDSRREILESLRKATAA